jgi:hypothetical protein
MSQLQYGVLTRVLEVHVEFKFCSNGTQDMITQYNPTRVADISKSTMMVDLRYTYLLWRSATNCVD